VLEAEVATALVDNVKEAIYITDAPEFEGSEFGEVPSENAGFTITMNDGEKFLVTVTRIEEG